MPMKNTAESQQSIIVYLTELSLYLIGHQQPRIPVTHLPNASMISLQRSTSPQDPNDTLFCAMSSPPMLYLSYMSLHVMR